MTKEELQAKVDEQKNIINKANSEIYDAVMEYINGLPYKEVDKVSTARADVCWITSIRPERHNGYYTGMVEVRINPAKKDGTRSSRDWVLWASEVDSIKKID